MEKQESIWKRLKNWLMSKLGHSQKALNEPKQIVNEKKEVDQYRTKTIEQMSNEEINMMISNRDHRFDEKTFFQEILLRIGINPELAKKIVQNPRSTWILGHHLNSGKLVEMPNGKIIFEDAYTHTDPGEKFPRSERTTISSRDGSSIEIKNTEDYSYYSDCMDGRPVSQVTITENEWNGVTLQNIETDMQYDRKLASIIAYNDQNVEMKKEKQVYYSGKDSMDTIILERSSENPFVVKESRKGDKEENETFYAVVNENRPDMLYSSEILPKEKIYFGVKDVTEIPRPNIDFNEMDRKNPSAARYFVDAVRATERHSGEEK